MTQSKIVALFEKMCLQTNAQPAEVRQAAMRSGLQKSTETQWSDNKTALNVHILTSDPKSSVATIKVNQLTEGSWATVKTHISKSAGYRGKGIGCAVSAYNLPIDRLANAVAPIAAKYGGQMRTKARGRVGQATVILNGKKMRLTTRPMKVATGVEFVFLSVAEGR